MGWLFILFFFLALLLLSAKAESRTSFKSKDKRGILCLLFPIFKPTASKGEMSLKFRLVAIQGVSR